MIYDISTIRLTTLGPQAGKSPQCPISSQWPPVIFPLISTPVGSFELGPTHSPVHTLQWLLFLCVSLIDPKTWCPVIKCAFIKCCLIDPRLSLSCLRRRLASRRLWSRSPGAGSRVSLHPPCPWSPWVPHAHVEVVQPFLVLPWLGRCGHLGTLL